MKYILIIVALLTLLNACKQEDQIDRTKDYSLVNDQGIFIELFDTSNTAPNRYTDNNKIYITDRTFTYDYYYQDKSGVKYKFEVHENASELDHQEMMKAWDWVEFDKTTEKTIDKIELKVRFGLDPFIQRHPEYNQSVISYYYPQKNDHIDFSSSTGAIENEKNVWIHPPRERFFRILEINPFPFIQAPYEIGNNWNWSLRIGKFWGDNRWKTWDGTIENKYRYEIVDKLNVKTKLGKLECYVIESTANSSIGTTRLTSYFNEDLGFVKLDYINIDSTKTVLEMIEFKEVEHDE